MSILITGGSKGIGRAIALRFSYSGNHVFINYHADDGAAEKTALEVEARGAHPHLLKIDVGTIQGSRDVLQWVSETVTRLDQLVHAAVQPLHGPLLESNASLFTQALNLNATALLYLVQAALPLLGESSCIFYLSSLGSERVIPNYAALGVAKAQGESLIRYMASELATRGIRANTIAPGPVDTEAYRAMFPTDGDRRLSIAAKAAGGQSMTPEMVADIIEFLTSEAASMIQGQVIVVDGGVSLR